MKKQIVLVIALAAGLAAAFLTRFFIASKDSEMRAEEARLKSKYGTIKVLGYRKDTPAGTVLMASDIGQKEVPKVGLRGQAIETMNVNDVIGRRTVVSKDANDVMFWSDIEGGDPSSRGLSSDIKPQMRAMSINVSGAASVSGMVKPNDHVDVIGTFDFPNDEGVLKRGDPVTCTILQNVLVLATGRETAKSRQQNLGVGQGYSTVTLEVTPREAEMLAFAEQIRGRLMLTLRSGNDTSAEKELPTVDFSKIRSQIEDLNAKRQSRRLR